MTHEAAVLKAREIADGVLAPAAAENDAAGRFSTEAVQSLGESGLLGLMLPAEVGGAALGPRTFSAVTATLAEADASVAMVYVMEPTGFGDWMGVNELMKDEARQQALSGIAVVGQGRSAPVRGSRSASPARSIKRRDFSTFL